MSSLPKEPEVKDDDQAQGIELGLKIYSHFDRIGFGLGVGKPAIILPFPYLGETDIEEIAVLAVKMLIDK